MVFGAAYSLWLCNRILFGVLNTEYIPQYIEINRREFFILFPLVICTIWMGVYPEIFLDTMHISVSSILSKF